MSYNSVGFRLDTLLGHFSNKNLMYGNDEEAYEAYIQELKNHPNKFVVSTPVDFGREITVSKLRNYVRQYKLDLLAIDGIKYLRDERGRKGDNLTTTLTNISEDLMELSVEMKIPVLVVVQANRTGASSADDDGTPSVESIRDSDGIAHNASKIISIKQKSDGILQMEVQKNRFGSMGDRLNYLWDIDTGDMTFVSADSRASRRRGANADKKDENQPANRPHKDKKNVF
jgi:replicative DNA helicase